MYYFLYLKVKLFYHLNQFSTVRRNFLKSTLAGESRAYGFTIAFWGSGTLLVKYNGLPELSQALLYGLGALTGFGLLTIYAYRSTLSEVNEEESDIMALSMIHYLGALLPITATSYTGQITSPYNFFLTGLSVSVLYNLGMVAEELLSEKF
jgi:hypothetical protein